MKLKNKINDKHILICIIILGLILRIIFSLRMNIGMFQYDLGLEKTLDDNNYSFYNGLMNFDREYLIKGGHLEYILTIYKTGHLPNFNNNQCYHPPLSHLIFASFLKIESMFTDNNKFLLESLEFVPIVYSMLILLVSYKIMKEIGFNIQQTILPISILTFHPLFIYLSRLINTDGLVSLLILLSILYLIKWYKTPSYKNVVILAFSIGLAAMAKTSAIVMALPLFIVYMKKLNDSVEDTKLVIRVVIQGFIFSMLTFPMVFWYPIRNYYKFKQPLFGIVTALDTLKISNNSFMARWILNEELFNEVLEKNASNVWANLIISTINFSIESFAIPFSISIVLRMISIILIVISIVSIIKYTINSKNNSLLFILMLTYFSWIIGYIYFNISMPYSCTIHARYIITAIVIGIIYIGVLYNNLKNKDLKYLIFSLSWLFNLLSIILFVYLCITQGIVTIIINL